MGIEVLAAGTNALWAELATVFTALIGWVGSVLTALTTSDGALYTLMPFLAIPIGFTLIGFGVGLIKRVIG